MYSNYNMPRFRGNMLYGGFNRSNRSDRFGGGFFVPFVLGGITGSLLTRPNNFGPYPMPYPAPYPVPYPAPYPYPPYQTYSENYYYY